MLEGVVFFPGQGSQWVGMGKEFYETFPSVRNRFEEASEALHFSLKTLCFSEDEKVLRQTQFAQPAVFTVSFAIWEVLEKTLGLKIAASAGHSLGEYTTLVALDAISFAQAVEWVFFRGKKMQEAVPLGKGAMAAVLGIEFLKLESFCAQIRTEFLKKGIPLEQAWVSPANDNSPDQVVISGGEVGVQVVTQRLQSQKKVKVIPLSVSAPFHCCLMEPAQKQMEHYFQEKEALKWISEPKVPYVSTVNAKWNQSVQQILPLLVKQITAPVRWRESVYTLLEKQGVSLWIECGPKPVLSSLVKKTIRKEKSAMSISLFSVFDLKSLKKLEKALKALKN